MDAPSKPTKMEDISPMLATWIKRQEPQTLSMKDTPIFYRNLEQALDDRRADYTYYTISENNWKTSGAVDFCSMDFLGLGHSGVLRDEYEKELARNPGHQLGAGASRVLDGNYPYLETVEREIAEFLAAQTGLIVGSGYEANVAIYTSIPRPGDAIVYDELVHSSTYQGISHSLAMSRTAFRHNDTTSFRDVLQSLKDSQPLIQQGKKSVLVAVESIYSMDGDFCPLGELVQIAEELFPAGNCQFVVDEAHSTGVIGPKGRGLVCQLGLQNKIAMRLHTFGKALGSNGAIILGNKTVKAALVNFGRGIIFTTAPSFIAVAGIRAGCRLLQCGATQAAQENIKHLVRLFFQTITGNRTYQDASKMSILWIPLCEDWENQPHTAHVVAIHTQKRHYYWLFFHLVLRNFSAWPVEYPTVPQDQGRVRIIFHGHNTEDQVLGLVDAICSWAQEMIDIQAARQRGGVDEMPSAARLLNDADPGAGLVFG